MTKTRKRIIWTAIAAVGFEACHFLLLFTGGHYGPEGPDAIGIFILMSHAPSLIMMDLLNLPPLAGYSIAVCINSILWFLILWLATTCLDFFWKLTSPFESQRFTSR